MSCPPNRSRFDLYDANLVWIDPEDVLAVMAKPVEIENIGTAFGTLASSPAGVTWTSPPCEHYSKEGR